MYKTAGKLSSTTEATLRARLVSMQEILVGLISAIKETRHEVVAYSTQLKEWRKSEADICTKDRIEMQRKAAAYCLLRISVCAG